MKKHITISIIVLMAVCVSTSFGRNNKQKSDADITQARRTAQAMKDADAQVGTPTIINWKEKKMLRMLYELRDQTGIVRYAYLMNIKTGKPVYLGKCIGYGLPYCVQFTNPKRIAHQSKWEGGSFGTMPQPEPNGLFMPQTLSATWLMMINPKTSEAEPVYIEPTIIVSPFKLPYAVGHPPNLK